jgi:hypothetical protein
MFNKTHNLNMYEYIYFNDIYSGINQVNEHLNLYISLIPFMQHLLTFVNMQTFLHIYKH